MLDFDQEKELADSLESLGFYVQWQPSFRIFYKELEINAIPSDIVNSGLLNHLHEMDRISDLGEKIYEGNYSDNPLNELRRITKLSIFRDANAKYRLAKEDA